MAKMPIRLRESLRATSNAWRERNEIPPGLYVTLVRKSGGRQVRDDTTIHRRVLPKRAPDNVTLKESLDELQATFLTEIERRGCTIKLRYTTNKENVDGRKLMSTVRKLKAVSDEDAYLNELPYNEQEILDVRNLIELVLEKSDQEDSFSNMTTVRGALRALVNRFGVMLLQLACEAESIL